MYQHNWDIRGFPIYKVDLQLVYTEITECFISNYTCGVTSKIMQGPRHKFRDKLRQMHVAQQNMHKEGVKQSIYLAFGAV